MIRLIMTSIEYGTYSCVNKHFARSAGATVVLFSLVRSGGY